MIKILVDIEDVIMFGVVNKQTCCKYITLRLSDPEKKFHFLDYYSYNLIA